MELIKKMIHFNDAGKKVTAQFFLDEDYNVPDAKNDVGRIVLSEGKLRVEELRHMENYLKISGRLIFSILYVTEEGEKRLASLEGKLPFEEMIYIEEQEEGRYQLTDMKVEFSASIVHSRKLSIKAVVDLAVAPEGLRDEEAATDVDSEESICKKFRKENLLELRASKKDTYRLKEEIRLPGTKENVGTILWSDITERKLETKLEEGALILQGELLVFVFYESAEGKLDWLEQTVPYEGRIEVSKAESGMYHHVMKNLGDINIDLRMDEDGEPRILGIEGTIDLKIAVYEEEEITFLEDVYSLQQELRPSFRKCCYESMVMQNHSKCKLTEQLSLPELQNDILQICHSKGVLQPESYRVESDGIRVEGVIHICFLYVKASDEVPFDVWQGMIPFSHLIESNETVADMKYDITTGIEQLFVNLLGGNQVEVKAVLSFQSFLKRTFEMDTIESIEVSDIDKKELEKRPGIVGYTVKTGDTLWALAKRYNTTVEGIREVNHLQTEEVKEGEKILIFKESTSIL